MTVQENRHPPSICIIPYEKQITNRLDSPGSSRCRLLGRPCEHGISAPRQSGWHRRECRRFSADSGLPGRYRCAIPSGRASGLSTFLEHCRQSEQVTVLPLSSPATPTCSPSWQLRECGFQGLWQGGRPRPPSLAPPASCFLSLILPFPHPHSNSPLPPNPLFWNVCLLCPPVAVYRPISAGL